MKYGLKKMSSIFLGLILCLVLIGCTAEVLENQTDDQETVAEIPQEETEERACISELMAEIFEQFAHENHFEFTAPLIDVARDHIFTFDLTKEAMDSFNLNTEIVGWSDIVGIYRDSAFTQQVAYVSGGDGENFTYVELSPFRTPIFPFPGTEREQFADWGNANQYFLVKYFDLLTGDKLEKPLVTVFNIATEIAGSPWIEFDVTDDGNAGFRWTEVAGADEYAVLLIREHQDGRGIGREVDVIARTSQTYWHDTDERFNVRNANFRVAQIGMNMDTLYETYREDIAAGRLSLEEFVAMQYDFEEERTRDSNFYFAVIALNETGTSAVSNFINRAMIAPVVPMSVAFNLNKGGLSFVEGGLIPRWENDILLAPSHSWVIMADGSVSRQLIEYDIELVREELLLFGTYTEYDEEGWPIIDGTLNVPALTIPYRILGTPFTGFIQITDYDDATFESRLIELASRQAALRNRTGSIARQINLNPKPQEALEPEVDAQLNGDFEIFASSPLSAYLALQMLNGQTRISLVDFPESSDHAFLVDAWMEAISQNPLILGARGIQLCWLTGDLLVTFDHDIDEIARQQVVIKERIEEIVEEIFTPGMTDLEKQTAINYFLINYATYDFAALDNAELNNFMFVDSNYYDSFTAYGILINGVGVCSGYADAFTLIANRIGLESVVVTGYLQGSLPHAWNRVNIEGQWYTLDVTNNDNEFFPNAFFNLTDDEARTILTEDDRWMHNSELHRFVSTSDAPSEYYRYRNRFFNREEIIDALVAGITRSQQATYRTDVMLTDEQFINIALEVMERTGNFDLLGGHFLGIITLFE